MAWNVLRTETATGPDGRKWEVDLLTGKTSIETPPAGAVLHGVMASAHQEEDWKFKVATWVPRDQAEAAESRVMAEAKRRVDEADWQAGEEYEI